MNKLLVMLPILATVVLSGCLYKSPTPTPTTTIPLGTPPTGEVKEFSISGRSYSLSPPTITVNKGDTVRITFTSQDIGHNIVIDKYNIRTRTISGGSTDAIEFVADKTGTFAIYCSVLGHRSAGMEGQLIVK